jgi:ribonuclease III
MEAPPLDELGRRLGTVLREPELIQRAFVHSSYFNENPDLVSGHNERLEFFGDAVIGVAVSRLLFERYPDEDEGFLTARRAALVNREALATLALELGLDRHLLLGRGEADAGGATRPSVLAACFEALAGALSLSEGTERAEAILAELFAPRLDALAEIAGPPKSAKSLLQEWSQRHRGIKPIYAVTATSGPPHEQRFRVTVAIDGRAVGSGAGSSRQRAEEQAAGVALATLRLEFESSLPPAKP